MRRLSDDDLARRAIYRRLELLTDGRTLTEKKPNQTATVWVREAELPGDEPAEFVELREEFRQLVGHDDDLSAIDGSQSRDEIRPNPSRCQQRESPPAQKPVREPATQSASQVVGSPNRKTIASRCGSTRVLATPRPAFLSRNPSLGTNAPVRAPSPVVFVTDFARWGRSQRTVATDLTDGAFVEVLIRDIALAGHAASVTIRAAVDRVG